MDAISQTTFWSAFSWMKIFKFRLKILISLKFVPKCPISNIPALVQKIACRRPGDKSLFEPMMITLLTHICVTGPQWVKFQAHPNLKGSNLVGFRVYEVFFSLPRSSPQKYRVPPDRAYVAPPVHPICKGKWFPWLYGQCRRPCVGTGCMWDSVGRRTDGQY